MGPAPLRQRDDHLLHEGVEPLSPAPQPPRVAAMLALQRSAGNHAVAEMLAAGGAQRGVLRENGKGTGEDKDAEKVEKEVEAKQKQTLGQGQLPEPTTDEDAAKADVLIDRAAARNGSGPQAAAAQKAMFREVQGGYKLEREVLAAIPDSAMEGSEESEEEETASDPVGAVEQLAARSGAARQAEAESSASESESESESTSSESESESSDESDEVPEAVGSRQALSQLSDLVKAPAAPITDLHKGADQTEAAAMRVLGELAVLERSGPQEPGLAKTGLKHLDDVYGPGPEATPSAIGGSMAAFAPVFSKVEEGGAGLTGNEGVPAFGTGFAATMDAIGNIARMVTGAVRFVQGIRAHKGIHKLTSKDSRIGLGWLAQGAGGAFAVLIGLSKAVAGKLSQVGEFLAGPVAGFVGVALSLVNAVLSGRRAWRAGKRRDRAAAVTAYAEKIVGWDERSGPTARPKGRAARQDHRFWNRLRAAAAMMASKAGRKRARKWAGTAGALLSAAGGTVLLLVTLGVAAANIWNPVGWALAGVALGVGIGLGIYKLWQRYKRSEHRRADLEAAKAPSFWTGKDKSTRVAPEGASDYARFVRTELDCKKTRDHEHADDHIEAITGFVKGVLRKDPKKVTERDESYIAGKWGSW